MNEATPDAPLVVATFLARYLSDKEEGSVQTLEAYQALFPGYESVVAREWERLQEGAPDATRGRMDERRIGKYVIEKELGRGGQGVVYRAHDTELRRAVALKVLPAGLARTSEMRQRLFREAEAASRLDDPGVCTVYEAGEHEGIAFIAMRLVEGESLAECLSRHRAGDAAPRSEALMLETTPDVVPPRREPGLRSAPGRPDKDQIGEFVQIIADCADILHRTHEAGLVHRDVKPGNVMIPKDGPPVLLDFGLARMEDHPDGSLTGDGDILGTPAYMSPEQLRDHHSIIDRRTDVYSLAVTLYECLTLRRPFEAPTRDRLYRQILDAEATGVSKWNPEVARDLAVVIACAMDKDRARRYGTCAEFSKDLRRCLRGEPVAARPVSPWTRSWRWVQRHPAVTAGVTLIVATSVSFALWQSSTSAELRKRATTTDAMRRAILATTLAEDDIEKALSEAANAVQAWPSLETRSAYYEVLSSWGRRTVLPVTKGPSLCRIDPSGTRAVVIDQKDLRIDVWDLKTLERLNSVHLEQRFIGISSIAFSQESVAIVINKAQEGKSAVWVMDLTRSADPVILPHEQWISAIAFSPTGDELVIGSGPRAPNPSSMEVTVGVWNLKQDQALRTLEPALATSVVKCGFFNRTNILAITDDGHVQRWRRDLSGDLVPDQIRRFLKASWNRWHTGMGFGHDDNGTIIGFSSTRARVLRVDGTLLPDPKHDIRGGIEIDRQGIFAIGAWDVPPIRSLTLPGRNRAPRIGGVVLSGGRTEDLSSGRTWVTRGPVHVWSLHNGRHLLTCGNAEDAVLAADLGADRTLATVQSNGSVSLWSESGLLINRLGGPGRSPFNAAISVQGRIVVMSTDRGLEFVRLPWHGEVLALASNDQVLALGAEGDLFMARATAHGPKMERRLQTPKGSLSRISSGAVGSRGHVAVTQRGRTSRAPVRVHIWRPDGSHTDVTHEGLVLWRARVAFSPDGSMLAVAGANGAAVMNADTGEVIRSWSTTPSDKALSTFDHETRIWFLSSNRVLVSPRKRESPDRGTHLFTLDAPASDPGEHLAVRILSVDDAGRTAIGFKGRTHANRSDLVIIDLTTLEIRTVTAALDGYGISDAVMSSDGRTFAVAQHATNERVQITWHDTADGRVVGSWALESSGHSTSHLSRIPGQEGLVYMHEGVVWIGITLDHGPQARIDTGKAHPGWWRRSLVNHDPRGRWMAVRSAGSVRFIPVNARAHASESDPSR